jgi:two-component system response regulator PilR (NtrC family)
MNSSTAETSTAREAAAASALPRILVLDDEPNMQRLMRVILEDEGYRVRITDSGHQALEWIAQDGCDLVVQDLVMPQMDGLTFLRLLRERHPEVLSIVVTAYGTWETAVEAMRLGAYTHIAKPFDTADFRQVVARALERKRFTEARPRPDLRPSRDIVGCSAIINAVVQLIKRIAPTDTTVLISGDSGTGKELVARAIHDYSLRAKGPFVAVNCGAFPESLLESELFGHVRGAFTNAIADRPGLFHAADSGTLFLDEVGETSPLMQVKLLRVLETRTYKPVGGDRESKADVRIIAATNKNLGQLVADGILREDLYHRLNVIPVSLPSLRERKEDIPLLAGHFLARYSQRMGKPVTSFEEAALARLMQYDWPGNIRELENAIERAVALSTADCIAASDITGLGGAWTITRRVSGAPAGAAAAGYPGPPSVSSRAGGVFPHQAGEVPYAAAQWPPEASPAPPPATPPAPLPPGGLDLERYMEQLERGYILQALERTGWNMTEAAKLLGMSFRSMRYRVGKLGIERPTR